MTMLLCPSEKLPKNPHLAIDRRRLAMMLYLRLNMGSIFLRALSPYGFAVKTVKAIGYTDADFLEFYKKVLDYILDINRRGRTFSEAYASLILQKVLTPYPVGYVDLQSPSGAGFGVVVYNYDGEVYSVVVAGRGYAAISGLSGVGFFPSTSVRVDGEVRVSDDSGAGFDWAV